MICPICEEKMTEGRDKYNRKIISCQTCGTFGRYIGRTCRLCKRLETVCHRTGDELMRVGKWWICRACFKKSYDRIKRKRDKNGYN